MNKNNAATLQRGDNSINSRDKLLELVDNSVYSKKHVKSFRVHDFPLDPRWLSESYADGEIGITYELESLCGTKRRKFRAFFERDWRTKSHGIKRPDEDRRVELYFNILAWSNRPRKNNVVGEHTHANGRDYKEVMLIDVAKFAKVSEVFVPSLVWLDVANSLDYIFRQQIHFGVFKGTVKRIGGVGHRKTNFRIASNEAGEIVKSDTHVLNGIAKNKAYTGRRQTNICDLKDIVDYIRLFSCVFESKRIGFSAGVTFDRPFKVSDVLVGPLEFVPNFK